MPLSPDIDPQITTDEERSSHLMNFDDQNRQWGKTFVVPPSGGCAAVKPPKGGTTSDDRC
jgi:hypothetical protein